MSVVVWTERNWTHREYLEPSLGITEGGNEDQGYEQWDQRIGKRMEVLDGVYEGNAPDIHMENRIPKWAFREICRGRRKQEAEPISSLLKKPIAARTSALLLQFKTIGLFLASVIPSVFNYTPP